MSILKFLGDLFKKLLPFLLSAAEKAFKKLPKEQQDTLIQISKLVEIIKQVWQRSETFSEEQLLDIIYKETGLTKEQATEMVLAYMREKGRIATTFGEAVALIWQDAENRAETGLKSLWIGFVNIVGSVVANVGWKVLLLGVAQAVFTNKVKGKVKI